MRADMVPTSTPSTMINVCTASVHTTAFMPPWKTNANPYKNVHCKDDNPQYPKQGNHTSLENKYKITNSCENAHCKDDNPQYPKQGLHNNKLSKYK